MQSLELVSFTDSLGTVAAQPELDSRYHLTQKNMPCQFLPISNVL